MDRFLPKAVYTLIIYRLELKLAIFRKFETELRPLIDVRISFLLNILRMNIRKFDQIFYMYTN